LSSMVLSTVSGTKAIALRTMWYLHLELHYMKEQ
jgi:hypothetical protein